MNKWPKQIENLTEEQQKIREDWMTYWHTILPNKYSFIEKFNQGFPLREPFKNGINTLEIGAGLGEHIKYENIENQNYFALELREEMADHIRKKFPLVSVITGDCQKRIDAPDSFFDRVLAIHVLEHLPDLPSALKEIHRVIKKSAGKFLVVIPCEGAFVYNISRDMTSRKIFEDRYNTDYNWLICAEHVNKPCEIIPELKELFTVSEASYFPFKIPSVQLNICIGLILTAK